MHGLLLVAALSTAYVLVHTSSIRNGVLRFIKERLEEEKACYYTTSDELTVQNLEFNSNATEKEVNKAAERSVGMEVVPIFMELLLTSVVAYLIFVCVLERISLFEKLVSQAEKDMI